MGKGYGEWVREIGKGYSQRTWEKGIGKRGKGVKGKGVKGKRAKR